MYKFVKQGLIILSSIAIVICLLVGCAIYYFKMSDVNYIVDFLNENPERTSFLLLENGEKVISFSPDNQMPLASVYKMLIALEFIRQVDEGMINPKEKIPLSQLDDYYIIKRDNDNHQKWIEKVKNAKGENIKSIEMEEIVRSIFTHSSNPNTDFLLDKLGTENINKTIVQKYKPHDKIYPIGYSELVCHYMDWKENNLSKETELNYEDYTDLVYEIKNLIDNNKYPNFKDYQPSLEEQETMSRYLPKSTATVYADIMGQINRNDFKYKKELIKLLTINQYNKDFEYVGGKDGKTLNIINKTVFTKDKEGNLIEIVFFTKDLNYEEYLKINNNIDDFIQKLLEGKLQLDYQ